jgi:hypothetical protein
MQIAEWNQQRGKRLKGKEADPLRKASARREGKKRKEKREK